MVGINDYDYKYLTDKIIKPVEYFINSYTEKCFELEITVSSTGLMRRILDAKYEKAYLNKVMTKQRHNLSPEE